MKGILYAQFKLLFRKPAAPLLMTVFMIVFALIMGNSMGPGNAYVPVYSEMDEETTDRLLKKLEEAGTQKFELVEEKEEMLKAVREGDAEAGILIEIDSYEFIIAKESPNFALLQQNVYRAYSSFLQEEKILASENVDAETVLQELNEPLFAVETKTFVGEDSFVFDGKLQSIFGMSAFFVIFTIAYTVVGILEAKQSKIWDRVILSPAKKWEMYVGILFYSFILGYTQIVIVFSVFKYGMGIDFYDGFWKTLIILIPYVLCVVSLSVLLVAISKNFQTYNVYVPLVSVSLAMIGGAYWPIEIVSNEFMLALSKIDPILYVMDALKSVTIYGDPLSGALYPISILLLVSVVLMGIGINLIERR
jgi:ABC-2 type transport system permease protein